MAEQIENPDITEMAAAWIARLDSGQLSAEQLIQLRDWAKTSPAHMRELERLADIWEGLDRLTALQPIMTQPKPVRRWTMRYPVVAASLAAASILMTMLYFTSQDSEIVEVEQVHVTELGEQRSVKPGDGSTISLNTNSGLQVAYSNAQRLVRLTHGEAFFNVESGDDRPFVVETDLGNVVVTGTAFLVRLEDGAMEVIVEEGSVQLEKSVDGSESDETVPTGLVAGEVARLESSGRRLVDSVEPGQMQRRLGWREGMLMFEGESLEEVVRELNRYTSVQISIDDPGLRERRIGGSFRIGETDDLLATLANDFDIAVTRISENEVRLADQRDQ